MTTGKFTVFKEPEYYDGHIHNVYTFDGVAVSPTDLNTMTHIIVAAKTNPALQEALDHVKLLYNLSKEYNNGI